MSHTWVATMLLVSRHKRKPTKNFNDYCRHQIFYDYIIPIFGSDEDLDIMQILISTSCLLKFAFFNTWCIILLFYWTEY